MMESQTFNYSNPFSSIDIRAKAVVAAWLEWQPLNFEQGFCVAPGLASFATTLDENYDVTVLESADEQVPSDCIFAVNVPFTNGGAAVCIRGGYSDIDIPASAEYQSATYLEFEGCRLEIRLSTAAAEAPRVLKPCPQYPRAEDFFLGNT